MPSSDRRVDRRLAKAQDTLADVVFDIASQATDRRSTNAALLVRNAIHAIHEARELLAGQHQ